MAVTSPNPSQATSPSPGPQTLVYDGDCSFCTRAAMWAKKRLPATVEVKAWQQIEDLEDLDLSPAEAASAAWWIGGHHTQRLRGSRAVAEALTTMGGGWSLMGRLMSVPPLSWLALVVYRVVALNRHRLPGGTAACKGG